MFFTLNSSFRQIRFLASITTSSSGAVIWASFHLITSLGATLRPNALSWEYPRVWLQTEDYDDLPLFFGSVSADRFIFLFSPICLRSNDESVGFWLFHVRAHRRSAVLRHLHRRSTFQISRRKRGPTRHSHVQFQVRIALNSPRLCCVDEFSFSSFNFK